MLGFRNAPDRPVLLTTLHFVMHYMPKCNAIWNHPLTAPNVGVTWALVVDVTVEERIERPRERVAAFAMDPANDARWILALDSVRVLGEGPLGVGTQVERKARFLGREIEYVNEIDAYDPPNRLAMHSVKAPFPMKVVYEFDEGGAGQTLARIRAGGDVKGFYNVAGPLLSAMVKRGISRDLRALKELMEADGPPPEASPGAPPG